MKSLKLLKKETQQSSKTYSIYGLEYSVESTVPMVVNKLSSIIKIQPGFITDKKANLVIIWREKGNIIRESFQKSYLLSGFKTVGLQ